LILYIYCSGGFGKEIMDVARRKNLISQQWTEIKYIDDVSKEKTKYDAEVLRLIDLINEVDINDAEFIIANGEPVVRKNIYEKLIQNNFKLGKLVDDSTIVAETANIADGVIVTPMCSISSDAKLSKNSCINTMSIIGHDVVIGGNTVISSMVNMGGACTVGDNSYIGMGALVKEGIKIGSNSIIGMGSIVYNDVPDDVIALGNPARVVKKNTDQKVFK